MLEKYEESLEPLDLLIELEPNDLNLLKIKAVILEAMEKYKDLKEVYENILGVYPNFSTQK
jgi:tetratricopeptide (TPR) repeat protein